MDEAGFNLTKKRRGRNVIGHWAIVGVPGQCGDNVTLCAAHQHSVVQHNGGISSCGDNKPHRDSFKIL